MRRIAQATILLITLAMIGVVNAAPPDEIRRLRGIIDKDEIWNGTILITDNLAIVGATVRVEPGTVIEFAGGDPNRRPTLTVGAEPNPVRLDKTGNAETPAVAGRLEMQGTSDRPIIVRTAAGSGAGRVLVTVRNVVTPARLEGGKIVQSAPATSTADRLAWKHVQFEGLGYTKTSTELKRNVEFWQPGVQIMIRRGGQQVSLENCQFRECSHLFVQSDDSCEVFIRGCRFEKAADASSVKIQSLDEATSARTIRFVENIAVGMITIGAGPCEFADNRLVGPTAGIAVRPDFTGQVSVVSNYVRCTDERDEGRYVATFERPDALVRNNVLIGGTYVVHQGSRQMSGNVIVAAPRLSDEKGGKSRTRRLVRSLPSGSVFENNLLIGPAMALMGPQRPPRPEPDAAKGGRANAVNSTIIRHNVFDGFDGQTRVLQMGLPRRDGGAIELYDNLVLRSGALVVDVMPNPEVLQFADYNAVVGGPEKLFLKVDVAGVRPGEDGWSKHDLRFMDTAAAGLGGVIDALPVLDDDVVRGSLSVSDARRRFIETYHVDRNSPLMGAGRPDGGKRGDIGLSDK